MISKDLRSQSERRIPMGNEVRDLWTEVGNKCLQRASELLDDKTASAAATAETVKCLVETAISMDMLNLRWAEKTRYGAAVFRGRPSSPPKAGN